MLKKIGLAVVVVLACILVFAATRPNSFRVERSLSINASPEKIFPLINDLQAWKTWSPYEKLDPAMKRTVSEPAQGKGATYDWEGNAKAGAGRMEIIESTPASRVAIQLDFRKPMEGHDTATFLLEPKGGATEVTWSLHGPTPYISKLVGMFFSMDRLIGQDFETGLASLKRLAEG